MLELKHVFSPLTVKHLTIPNRLVVAPMVTNYCNNDGTATERYVRYHETKARGGFGLIITEDYAVTPRGKGFVDVAGLWNDGQIAGHSQLPPRVHAAGAKIFAQIYHCGRQTSSTVTGATPEAPSAIPDPFNIEVPRELSIEEIERIIDQFGDCALRAKKCGFDGVQLHGAHGYLLSEFMSPYANKRTDEYGGPLLNRLRFPLAVIKNVREKCGGDFILDYRISGDEFVSGGRTIEDTKTIVPFLVDAGLDMIHVTAGVYFSVNEFIPPQYMRHANLADLAAEVKKVTDVPVVTVCRVNDPYIAEELIASGKADMVAMGRASLADPDLPRKAGEGRFEDIRHCIGCNFGCVGYLFDNKPITCIVNPTVGLEYLQPDKPAEVQKNVAVIGGGPAGMQAAISAAGRGHTVTLYEKSGRLGGQFRAAAMPPAKGELTTFIAWQETQLKKLGIEVKLNTEAAAGNIGRPDAVILASGAAPIIPDIPGKDGPNVVLANDILLGKKLAGRKVVVIGGGQAGAETADYLANTWREVVLIELLKEIAPLEALAPRAFLLKSLKEGGVRIFTETKVERIGPSSVITGCGREFEADTVVLAVGVRSDNALAQELEAAGLTVHVIGDALKPRNLLNATKEGHETAVAL